MLPDVMCASRQDGTVLRKGAELAGTRIIPLYIDRERYGEALNILERPLFSEDRFQYVCYIWHPDVIHRPRAPCGRFCGQHREGHDAARAGGGRLAPAGGAQAGPAPSAAAPACADLRRPTRSGPRPVRRRASRLAAALRPPPARR